MIKIAVIDDGITRINDNIIICNQYEYIDGIILPVEVSDEIKCNHGSICAALIAEKPTEFYSIRIIQNGRAASIESLRAAIDFASALDVNVIHISLGSFRWIDGYHISKAVSNAVSRGIFIVGSVSSDGRRTFPGSFSNVIGVCSTSTRTQEYVSCEPNLYNINVFANVRKNFLDTNIGPIHIPQKSSYAAAVVTKKLCEWLGNADNNGNNLEDFYRFIDNTYHSEKTKDCKMSVQKKLLRGISILQSVKFSHVSDEVKIVETVKIVAEAIEVVNMYGTAVPFSHSIITNSSFGVDDLIAEQDTKSIAKLYCSNQLIELL